VSEQRPGVAQGPSTLVQLVDGLRAAGYDGEFSPLEGGLVRCTSCREERPAAEFEVGELRRTEGASDPDDMAAAMGLTCPACGNRGVLVTMYGPEASEADADVLRELDTR
jgi:hypothetical protein